jgi:hypothetical protein
MDRVDFPKIAFQFQEGHDAESIGPPENLLGRGIVQWHVLPHVSTSKTFANFLVILIRSSAQWFISSCEYAFNAHNSTSNHMEWVARLQILCRNFHEVLKSRVDPLLDSAETESQTNLRKLAFHILKLRINCGVLWRVVCRILLIDGIVPI